MMTIRYQSAAVRKGPSVTEYKVFPDRGHSLTIDSGWKQVVDESLSWLRSEGL